MDKLRALAVILEKGEMGQWVREIKMEQVDILRPALTDRQLKAFFAALPHLEHLDLGAGCSNTQRLVLSQSITRASLRSMTRLSLHEPEDNNPFEPAQFRLLNAYPSLTSLSINSNRDIDDLYAVTISKKKVEKLSGITELRLNSEAADTPLIKRLLVEACPSLKTLVLDTTSHNPDYRGVLPRLPPTLTHLELRTRAFYDAFTRPCDTLLLPFSALHTLYLGEGTFTTAIFPLLRQFSHLTSLGFGKGAVVPIPELVALVDSAAPLTSLRVLILDIVEGKRGWKFFDDRNGNFHPDADPNTHLGLGWVPPRFSCDFSDREVREAIETLKKKGVKVEGTTVAAIEIDLDFFCELSIVCEMHCLETGDFNPLRELMGDKYVDERLQEMDAELGFYDDESYGYDEYYECG